MTEFKGLELVIMEKTDPNNSKSEYKITLNPKFNWFLEEEFKKLREEFKPTNYQNELKNNKRKSDVRKNTPVQEVEKQQINKRGKRINKKNPLLPNLLFLILILTYTVGKFLTFKNEVLEPPTSLTSPTNNEDFIEGMKLSPNGPIHLENEEEELH